MESWQVRICTPVLFILTIGLSGCHVAWSFDEPTTSVDSVRFMTLWRTYSHCRSSSDPDEMRAHAEQLDRTARAVTSKAQAPPLLPDFIQTLISEPLSRLAIDPEAMVMACTLYAGQTAQTQGRPAIATEMFKSILAAKPEVDYAQYVNQASRGLEELEQDRQFVMDTRDQAVQVVSR